ncbi:TetR/AcrR family transcriptional regulator [Streptomyces fragilis]|uniref:TetR/AcrR family transcriptional regulator n=1 Tax=Streptomyces fragilis TaxID=67301 RepID=A0ABV2YBI5_9ACTN|nr:TetR/AcrR family transcriptional regulator [Streptomyces fragilis]
MTTPTPQLRKDAARNRERIVAVARDLVDQGTALQLNDVARRAGVGVATVYRHFATPEALLEAVATPCLEGLVAHGEQALTDTDPWRALAAFLSRVVEAQLTDAALPPVAAAAEDALPRTTQLKTSLERVGTALLERARDAGAVRPDLAAADLVPLMCGIAHAVTVRGGTSGDRTDTARRYLATLLEGMRPAPPRT